MWFIQISVEKLELSYITSGNRLVKRLVSREISTTIPITETEKMSSNIPLPLPNAFKAFVSLSTDNLTVNSSATREQDLSILKDEVEIAHLPLEGPVSGTCTHVTARGWRALVWTPSQLLVQLYTNYSKPILTVRSNFSGA